MCGESSKISFSPALRGIKNPRAYQVIYIYIYIYIYISYRERERERRTYTHRVMVHMGLGGPIYTNMHTHTYIHTHIRTYIHTHMALQVMAQRGLGWIQASMTNFWTSLSLGAQWLVSGCAITLRSGDIVYIYTYIYIHMCVCVCVCMCVYM